MDTQGKNIPPKMGRPPSENPMTGKILVMVTPDKLTEYKAAAKASGMTFSAWVRGSLDRTANAKNAVIKRDNK